MRRRNRTAGLFAAFGLMLAATPAHALITSLTPLGNLLKDSTFICTATVESVDADKPSMVLAVNEDLKDKLPVRKLAVLLKGDAESRKGKHVPMILKRVAPKLPLVLFALKRDKKYTAFAYTNGTWFQMIGVEADGTVRWSFTHGELYLRKTYKGTTADLKQVIVDGLSGKKKPPEPDTKEKPGFGPEVEAEKKSDSRPPVVGGPLFAVIPSVLIGGPLAILAMLFPAVFGGMMLVFRRWMAALSVLSLNSTLYSAQSWFMPWLVGSWWATPMALWLAMTVVALLGILWAWRRHISALRSPLSAIGQNEQARTAGPGRVELITLGVLSAACLATVAFKLPHTLAQLDLWGKTLLMFSAGLWMATLHAFYLRWLAGRRSAVKPGLPGEGVLLWTMLLVGVGFSATLGNESSAPGVSDEDAGPYRVAWRFRPGEGCWMASSPVFDDERIYVGAVVGSSFGDSGAVWCVDRATGKELWVFNDGGSMKKVFSSPCLADGRLYVGEGFHQDSDCKMYCLDAATGAKRWEFATGSHTESSPCVAGGKVYFGAGDDGLFCLDAASGKEQWHFKGLHIDANPLVVGKRLYGGSGVGDYFKEPTVFCLDADTGKQQWRMPLDLAMWGKPTLFGEHLYVGIGNGDFVNVADKPAGAVMCLEAATGKRVWRYDVGNGVYVRVSVDAKNVWFASRDQHCYCLDRPEGAFRWKTDLSSPIVASPFLVEGESGSSLYAVGTDGQMSRLDPETGKIVWTFDVVKDAKQSATVYSSPTVQVREGRKGESRLIWFGSRLNDPTRGILYCLEERAAGKVD